MSADLPRLAVREVTREYQRGAQRIQALAGVSFSVAAGEFVSIVGPSGAGKSTLLHLLGALDIPTSGSVVLDGTNLETLDDDGLSAVRRRRIGFIFQFFNLLPTLTAWENVAVPRMLDGTPLRAARPDAVRLLERVNLGDRIDHRPFELSGGQMQRVAIARALIMDPLLVLADEPTGNLDTATGDQILALLRTVAREEDRAVIMVTHNAHAAAHSDRLLVLEDGRITFDGPPNQAPARGMSPAAADRA
jgi:putative ABC transport system ATP-binding protein